MIGKHSVQLTAAENPADGSTLTLTVYSIAREFAGI
jgi:hypothetical protein